MTEKISDINDVDTGSQHMHCLAMAKTVCVNFFRKVRLCTVDLGNILVILSILLYTFLTQNFLYGITSY